MKTFLLHVSRQLIRYRLDGALLALFISTALAAICQANQPSNGLPPRPFYVTGHNPNGVGVAIRAANFPSLDGWSSYWTTENQVKQCLDNGANALEPDISLRRLEVGNFEGDPLVLADLFCNDSDDLGQGNASYLKDWLTYVHNQVVAARSNSPGADLNFNNLCLIPFDCKSLACVNGSGKVILKAVRDYLNKPDLTALGPPINIMISCASVSDGKKLFLGFNQNSANPDEVLLAHEGLMVDSKPNVDDVITMFRTTLGFTGNIGYGAGSTAGPGALYGPSLHRRFNHALFARAQGRLQMVPYVYTITSTNQQSAFLQTGMDGIIAERDDIAAMKNLLTGRSDLRYAVPSDNLLIYQPNHPSAALGGVARTSGVCQVPAQFAEAYGVQFHTRAVANAGTDAVLTVRVIGPNGFSETTVDTSADTNYGYNIIGSRMENGDTDYVTIYSPDLGQPLSLRVYNNGANPNGVGGPDWEVDRISVYSARYLGPGGYYHANNVRIFAGGSTTTFAMTASGVTLMNVYSRIGAPAGGNGTIGSPYQTFSSAYQFHAAFGTIHMGAGVYNEVTTTLDLPGKIVREPTYPGTGPVRLGHP